MNEQPPVRSSGLAIASLVLGLVSLLCGAPAGIAAIICGAIALSNIKNSAGATGGRGLAITGLVTGSVGTVVTTLALLAAMLLPALAQARGSARRANCMSNMKQIGLGIAQYCDDHNQQMPRTFDDILPYVGNSRKILICPEAADQSTPSYYMVAGVVWQDTNITVLVTEPDGNHGGRGHNALYNDGSVQWRSVGSRD
jgi:hypothetical protein